MNKMAKNNKMPAIRFSGYTDAWEQRKLGDLTQLITKGTTPKLKNIQNGINFIKVENISDDGVISINSYVSEEEHTNYLSRSILANNDILFSIAGTLGRTAIVKSHLLPANTNQALAIIRLNKSIDVEYINTFLKSNAIKIYIKKNPTVGAQPNLSLGQVSELEINIPSYSEQNKISDLFSKIDLMITLHQRKLEKLKLTKKALLQKLFPKNGSNIPELRFKGVTDAWEQRKLSDISTKVTTKNVDVHYTETLTNSAEQGIISQVDFFDKEISNKDNINGYYIVENNDFIYNPRISTLAPVGPINRNKLNRTGIMSPLYTVFRASKVDLGFLEWYFQSYHWHRYMKLNGDSGARADRIAIKDSTFFEMPIKTPVNIKEQVLIGEILEKFNQYITLHQRKLEMLKNVKKGLLQKMFV